MVAKPITDATHLILDDTNIKWLWTDSELILFREMWNEGIRAADMAKALKTNQRSIALVVMDQAELGEIKQRASGLYGNQS